MALDDSVIDKFRRALISNKKEADPEAWLKGQVALEIQLFKDDFELRRFPEVRLLLAGELSRRRKKEIWFNRVVSFVLGLLTALFGRGLEN